MITSTNGSMELLISEPHFLPSLIKSHHYYHDTSANTSKEIQNSNSKSKIPDVKLRNPLSSISKVNSLTINESHPVMTIDKTTSNRLSPIYDEDMKKFSLTIPSDNNNSTNQRLSPQQATLFAHRHFHIYDWTRISFYDNVPAPLGYLSEPLIIEDRSPTSTSSNDDKHSSLDQKDSILLSSNNIKQQLICSSSTSSSSTSSSCLSLNSNLTNRFPTTRKIRVKWHSFTKTHRPSFNSSKYHLGQMSVGQLLALRRAALIQIQELFGTTRILSNNKSTLIDRTTTTTTTTSRPRFLVTAFSAVPRLIIRKHQQRKEIHHEIKKTVFGVSLLSMTQRTGHPVPITIMSAMKYLRRTAIDSVGIFRKPGVAHRIKRLHDLIESDFEFHQFDDFSPYDVSDVLKQYFRFLPECLFTNKLSSLFLQINEKHFSNEQCLLALQYALLLLPDENRLVLHLLLSFLNDISKHSKTNQMSSINLATCFAPTLFSFRNYNKISTNGMPDIREIQEQRKAMDILAYMIDNVRYLFLVPYQLHQTCQFSYIEIGEPCTLEELSRRISDPQLFSSTENLSLNTNNNNNNSNVIKIKSNNRSYQNFIDRCIIEVMRESCTIKPKGWTSFGKMNQLELAFKKLDDGHPLGLWKCSIEIEAPPIEILHRLLYERHLWDDDFQSGSIIEKLNPNTHVYQYTMNSMAPLASRYFCELRSWKTNIQLNTKKISSNMMSMQREACVLICTSIEHPKGHCPPTLVRAVTLASRYLIQSNGCGKSKVTHLSRVDLMGRSHEWYSKVYGSILTRSMSKLRDSFIHINNTGPETKV